MWIRRRKGPRTEFLGPTNILWLGKLAKETNMGLAVYQALVQHFLSVSTHLILTKLFEVRTIIVTLTHFTNDETEEQRP